MMQKVIVRSVALMSLTASGCQTVPVSPKPTSVATGTIVPLPTDRLATADEALNDNPSARRLTDIEGTLLEYYALHKTMPKSLDELKALADIGTDLHLTSPPSGKPYLYFSDGLMMLGAAKRIIVADPEPNARGQRYCILLPRIEPGQSLSMEVLHMPEGDFQKYVPAGE